MDVEEFLALVETELGLPVGPQDVDIDFDDLPRWDSVYLLKLLTAIERVLGRRIPVARLLEARTLGMVHALVVGADGARGTTPARTP